MAIRVPRTDKSISDPVILLRCTINFFFIIFRFVTVYFLAECLKIYMRVYWILQISLIIKRYPRDYSHIVC